MKIFPSNFWHFKERITAYIALTILLIALILFVAKIIHPLENMAPWGVISEWKDLLTVIDQLTTTGGTFGIPVPTMIVKENFVASIMEIPTTIIAMAMIIGLLGLSMVLAAITTLPRFWYIGSMVIFMILLAFSGTDMLGIHWGHVRFLFLFSIVAIGSVSYYLHAFLEEASLPRRLAYMTAVVAALTLFVTIVSPVEQVAVTAFVYSLPLWIGLAIIFLFLCATEILAAIVWVCTAKASGLQNKSMPPFLVGSVLYLTLLVLLYLRNTKQLAVDVTLVSPAILAVISGVLGIVGFEKRCDATQQVLNYRHGGWLLYIGLFICTLAVAFGQAALSNDPILEVLEDTIVNTQLAMGVVFFFYVLLNFAPLFRQGLEVHKVLYKPMRFDLTKTRLIGFGGVIALFSMQNLFPMTQGIAGYFNGLGDLHTLTKEYTLAEQYYKMGLQYEFQNHKSNYALASLAVRQDDATAAAYYFKQATLKNPSPQAFVGLGNVLIQENLYFDALFALQNGYKAFPENGEIANNLGMLFDRSSVADSAYHYLSIALDKAHRPEVPATNLLAVLASSTTGTLQDSLTSVIKEKDYIAFRANKLALKNLQGDFAEESFQDKAIPKDSLLSVSSMAYVYNYNLNQAANSPATGSLAYTLAVKNPLIANELSLASIYPEFYSGDKLKAMSQLQAWAKEETKMSGLFNLIAGHWWLQLGIYPKAEEAFTNVAGKEGLVGQVFSKALQKQYASAGVLVENMLADSAYAQDASLRSLQSTLAQIQPLPSAAHALLKEAITSQQEQDFARALQANPIDGRVVSSVAEYYQQHQQAQKALQLVTEALYYNEEDALLWKQYALLALEEGLVGDADEAARKAAVGLEEADYERFKQQYQQLRTKIEQQRSSFQ